MPKSQEEMNNIFTYHSPKGDQPDRYERNFIVKWKIKGIKNIIMKGVLTHENVYRNKNYSSRTNG